MDGAGFVTQHGYNKDDQITLKRQYRDSLSDSFTLEQAQAYLTGSGTALSIETLEALDAEQARETHYQFDSLGPLGRFETRCKR